MVRTKAGRALARAVDPSSNRFRMSQSALARMLGISQPSVSEWVRLRSRPEPHFRDALEIILGIPRDDWMTAAERAVVAGAARAMRALRSFEGEHAAHECSPARPTSP